MEKRVEKEKRNILEEEGSSRTVLSGAYSFIFAILGSLLLWLFTVIATGNPGLAYYGEILAILGIFQVIATGFSQAFIARVKTAYLEDPDLALIKAATYTKVLIFIGILIGILAFCLALLIPDPFIQICLLIAIPPLILAYVFNSLGNMICVKNRYDIAAFLGSFFGIIVFIVGITLVLINADPIMFTLIPIVLAINWLIWAVYFYKKVSPFSLKDLYTKGKLFSQESKDFVKYSSFSTLTNLESIGLLGNLILFLATLSLFFWYPESQILAVQIITIVMVYAIVKVAIIFFASPLNVEIAEAIAKDNKEIIQQTITDTGRIAFIIGLTLATLVCAGAGHILRVLHSNIFLMENGQIDENLLITSQILLILCAIGQACYGFAALFGNALIGSGQAKYSAIAFGITLILTFILTPILIFQFGFIGAGITMIITGFFVLPFMLIALKRILNVKLNFKVLSLMPVLAIVFLLIFFYPLDPVLEHISTGQNLKAGLIGLIMLLGIVFAFIIGIPFFGVMGPGDGKLIRDISLSFNLEAFGNFLIKLGRYFYYLNPLHKKP
ncbi:MAG: oligosaccharide flippase family protein [Promethearchaeota archaeon]